MKHTWRRSSVKRWRRFDAQLISKQCAHTKAGRQCKRNSSVKRYWKRTRKHARRGGAKKTQEELKNEMYDIARKGDLDEMVKRFEQKEYEKVEVDELSPQHFNLLNLAIMSGNLDMVRYLVEEKNADIDFRIGQGFTSLSTACRFAKLSIVEYLFEKGVDWDTRNDNGVTPLMVALIQLQVETGRIVAERNQTNIENLTKIVKLLLEKGANLEETTVLGTRRLSARDLANMVSDETIRTALVNMLDKEEEFRKNHGFKQANVNQDYEDEDEEDDEDDEPVSKKPRV